LDSAHFLFASFRGAVFARAKFSSDTNFGFAKLPLPIFSQQRLFGIKPPLELFKINRDAERISATSMQGL
jgi:hypothetical protein